MEGLGDLLFVDLSVVATAHIKILSLAFFGAWVVAFRHLQSIGIETRAKKMLIENGASVFPDIEIQAYREGLPVMIRGDAVCGDYSRGIVNAHVDCRRQLMVVRVLNVEVTGLVFRGRLRAKEVRPFIRAQSSIPLRHIFEMRRPEQCHS